MKRGDSIARVADSLVKRPRAGIRRVIRWKERLLRGGHSPGGFIVGAQKAGTSSLFQYLQAHPQLTGAQSKEVGFFDKEYRFRKGIEWYERQFVQVRPGPQIYFEATPEYLYRKIVPERISSYYPEAKIVILLRDPIGRAYSAWNMYRELATLRRPPSILKRHFDGTGNVNPLYSIFFEKRTPPSFEEYLDIEFNLMKSRHQEEEPGIVRRGIYRPQIERYVNCFGWHKVLILGSGELRDDTARTVGRVATFLTGIQHDFGDVSEMARFHARKYAERISEQCFNRLSEFYEPHNSDLWNYLGKRIEW